MVAKSTSDLRSATAVLCLLDLRRYRRHTSAVHLLRGGVAINTIRAWLGHQLQTTNVYVDVDLEMKAKALKCMDTGGGPGVQKRWHKKPDLLEFLRSI